MRKAMVLALVMTAAAAAAEEVKVETTEAEGVEVKVYTYDFLSKDELTTLRLVATNADARALFVPEGDGFAALAVAPREGFIKGGQPVPSATAVAGLPDAAAAAAQAVDACNKAKSRGPDCVVVLEVAAK
jgi:hypothetical protein